MSLRSHFVNAFRLQPTLPGDKSITHRAYILGAMAAGETRVMGANPGADCRHTLAAVGRLGARVTEQGDQVRVAGTSGRLDPPDRVLDLGNSGTGLRLLLGALAAQPFTVTLTGDASLCRRPVERVLRPLRAMGAHASADRDHPPVTLTGAPLRGIRHAMEVSSAQVKSALLLAGLMAEGQTWIGNTAGTRDHTERMLPAFGATSETGPDWVSISGPQALRSTVLDIPRDISAATFYLVAAAIRPGSHVRLEDVGLNPTRTKVLEVMRRMGLDLTVVPKAGASSEPSGTIHVSSKSLEGTEVTPDEVPHLIDELPVLAVLAAFADGTSRVRGAAELRHKESNRLVAMAEGLNAMGAAVTLEADGWTIEGSGGEPLAGGEVRSQGDHRVAMSLLVAGLGARMGCVVVDEPLVETSDPFFPQNLARLLANA